MKKWLAAVLAALAICACLGVKAELAAPFVPPAATVPPPLPLTAQTLPNPPPEPSKATVLAVGDNLIHDIIYQTAGRYAAKPGEYDFRPFYAPVQHMIAAADVASVNQETPLAGSRPLSNFPLFNSPPALAAQLADVGFDAVTVANNHMLDQGASGLHETLDALHAVPGLAVAGAYRTEAERDVIPLLERNGITFAFLGYTQLTNGLVLPKGQEFRMVAPGDRDTISRQLAAARKQADVVIVNIHWGDEYSSVVNARQKELAQFLADGGADVIFGHHPHVLQLAETMRASDGRAVPVFYSLGNFLSAQHSSARMVGAMARVTFQKDPDGQITCESPVIVPVVTHFNSGFGEIAVYPLASYTDSLAAVHAMRQRFGEPFALEWIRQHVVASCGGEYEIEGV